ncbi:MAG: TRAP transporter small permease [Alphaproteobacteria bacterium]
MPDRRHRTDAIARLTDPLLDRAAQAATLVSGVSLVVLIAIFGWLVYGRYVVNETPTWVEQVAMLLIVVIAFLSGAVGVRENSHLSVTALVTALPPRGQRGLRLLADLVMTVFGGILTFQAVGLAAFGWTTLIPLIDLPEGVRALPIAVAGVLIFIFAGVRVLRRLAGVPIGEDRDVDPEVADALASPAERDA